MKKMRKGKWGRVVGIGIEMNARKSVVIVEGSTTSLGEARRCGQESRTVERKGYVGCRLNDLTKI